MKQTVTFFLLTVLLLATCWAVASETISNDLSQNITRLHIVANSNDPHDQALKLKVRDRLLAETKKSSRQLSNGEITATCRDEIQKNGYHYSVTTERGQFYFPRKTYKNLTLPAGTYNAVRITIGEGGGANWWCVMYPPLCFAGDPDGTMDDSALSSLRHAISPESFAMICEADVITVKPSFLLVELWNKLKEKETLILQ